MNLSLPLQMAIATFLGIFTGLFLGEITTVFSPWADAYIMMLKITAIPYLAIAIIHGIGQLNRGQAKQIFKKGLLFISCTILLNISVIYLMKWVFPQTSEQSHLGSFTREIAPLNFADLLIPENIFYDLANNIVPAVVVFSLLVGIALMHLGEKQSAMSSLQTILEALTRITSWISRITPIGTFLIISYQFGTMQFEILKQMATYISIYILGASLIVFWIVPRFASILTPISAREWFKSLIPVLVLVYTTNLVIVSLPYIINIVQRKTQMLYPKDENARSQIQGTVSIIFNLPFGSIFISVFVFFIAIFYMHPLPIAGQFQLFLTLFLTSLGAVGIGSWINNLTFILDSLGLPIDAVNLYLTTLPFTAGFQSMISAMLISTLSLIITLACRNLLTFKWKTLFWKGSLTLLPLFLIFGFIKYVDLLPAIKNPTKSIYDLEITSDIKVRRYERGSLPSPRAGSPENTLERILSSKILRVGYDPHIAPFCFINQSNQLAGYDVSLAIQLAYDLGCDLEFVPLDYGKIDRELQENLYDIGMSAISITSERLKSLCFPIHYLDAKIVFVSLDKRRKLYSSLDYIRNQRNLKIAVLKGSSFQQLVALEFPGHPLILLDSYEDFSKERADLLVWEEQEAIAWTIQHPEYQVIFPLPGLGKDSLGYPVNAHAHGWICYLNGWMKLKENDGFIERQYDLWVLGKTDAIMQIEPRWSILRNVLHAGY